MSRAYNRWNVEEEHALDRFYRGEQQTVHDIASRLSRTTSAVRIRLTLLYFGVRSDADSQRDLVPWSNADDAKLNDLYFGSRDRDDIFLELGRRAWSVASRMLEVIPRSQLSLTKTCLIRFALGSPSLTYTWIEIALANFLKTSSCVKYRVLQSDLRINERRRAKTYSPWISSRVVICSLGFLWEDHFRGLSQIVLERRRTSMLHPGHPLPHNAARAILKCLALPL